MAGRSTHLRHQPRHVAQSAERQPRLQGGLEAGRAFACILPAYLAARHGHLPTRTLCRRLRIGASLDATWRGPRTRGPRRYPRLSLGPQTPTIPFPLQHRGRTRSFLRGCDGGHAGLLTDVGPGGAGTGCWFSRMARYAADFKAMGFNDADALAEDLGEAARSLPLVIFPDPAAERV